MADLRSARKLYAESIRQKTNLLSEHLVRALAEVPREDYLGPGPWKIMRFVFPLKYGFSLPGAMSQGLLGWAQAQLGSSGEGVSSIRRSLADHAENSSRLIITDSLTRLAEAQVLDGAIEDALSTLEDALQADPEELVYQPNILTCRGELRLKTGHPELAEADFREAIALAQKMSAKAWELRATTRLARLLGDANRRDEARAMLAEIYNWFTEGFDTADLKDAKALLEELSNGEDVP